MMIGRVDEVDGHFIATRFVALSIPTECMYVTRNGIPRTTSGGSDGVRIRPEWRSVGLGYLRVWVPALAVAIPLLQLALGGVPTAAWFASAASIAVSAISHRWGLLPEEEKARLRLLGTITGLRIDPEKLQSNTRDRKRDALLALMEKGGIPTTPKGILFVLDDIPQPAIPLVYSYACYAGDDLEWRGCAERVYARHARPDLL
jgi:hypothetical protein